MLKEGLGKVAGLGEESNKERYLSYDTASTTIGRRCIFFGATYADKNIVSTLY